MVLVEGRYKCNWCGSDLDLLGANRETIEIICRHEVDEMRLVVVAGEEHHRCRRPTAAR